MTTSKINRDELTDRCDSGSCDYDSGMWHVRQAGVFCAECAAKRVKYSFDPDQEQADLDRTRAEQAALLAANGIDANASEL